MVVNDTRQPAAGTYRICKAGGQTVAEGSYRIEANGREVITELSGNHGEQILYLLEWTTESSRYGNHYLTSLPPLDLSQYRNWLTDISRLPGEFSLTIT